MGWRGRRAVRVAARVALAGMLCGAMLLAAALVALRSEHLPEPDPAARGSGRDALWLGHAWVDGRKEQSDVDQLARRLKTTGVRDLFVHAGPLEDDGTLRMSRVPRATWFVEAVHAALPGVRVQAWLGAHVVPGKVPVENVLELGFDGVHFDFEPIVDGDPALVELLRQAREVTRRSQAILSVSAIHHEPWPGVAACVDLVPGPLAMWSEEYLGEVAAQVDQIAVMSYDTGLPTEATYGGYVRRATESALRVVPREVALLMGVPAYHDHRFFRYDSAETVAAAVKGIRLALGSQPPQRDFGVAIYVDFAATEQDWASYHRDWLLTPTAVLGKDLR